VGKIRQMNFVMGAESSRILPTKYRCLLSTPPTFLVHPLVGRHKKRKNNVLQEQFGASILKQGKSATRVQTRALIMLKSIATTDA